MVKDLPLVIMSQARTKRVSVGPKVLKVRNKVPKIHVTEKIRVNRKRLVEPEGRFFYATPLRAAAVCK